MDLAFRHRGLIEAEVQRLLERRGQQLVSIEPELVRAKRVMGRAENPLSIDAQAFEVVARSSDASLQTYHWAYEPMARGDRSAGLRRYANGFWLDML